MGSLWNRSGMVERYADDLRASGAKAFFFQGGTTSRLTVFRDSGESSAHTNPVVADSNGRWPDVFIPYVVSYDVQVKSADDVQLTYSLQIPNPDPVDLSVVIPAEERIQTGMIHGEFVNATKPGYVRLNGRTIGNAASLATERANGLNNLDSDCFNLFNYLYNNLPNTIAAVSGGRGSSATSDFNANKNITLPSMQGASLIGLDDMGNTAAGAFTGLTFNTGGPINPGSSIGINANILSVVQMPPHLHSGTTARHLGHQHSVGGDTGTELRSDTRQFAAHSHAWGTSGGSSGGVQGVNGRFATYANSQAGYDLNHAHAQDARTVLNQGGGGATGGNPAAITGGTTASSIDSGYNLDHAHFIDVGGTTATQDIAHFHTWSGVTPFTPGVESQGAHDHTFSTDTRGGLVIGGAPAVAQPFNNIPLARTVTWFIKL